MRTAGEMVNISFFFYRILEINQSCSKLRSIYSRKMAESHHEKQDLWQFYLPYSHCSFLSSTVTLKTNIL